MIADNLEPLEAVTSLKKACELIGANRSTIQRRRRPPLHGPPAPRPAPPNKLTEPERQHILTVLRSEEFYDLAPAQVWARLLDDGIYLCSIRTMLRLVELALEMSDFDLAKRAIGLGVTALQLTEVMARARMRVAAAEQDARSIAAVYRQLQDELLRVFDHDEPSEETQTLRDELLASLSRPETERSDV